MSFENIKITKCWVMPSPNTFSIEPIKKFVEYYLEDKQVIVDPFANSNTYGTITNDLNPNFETTYHLDALKFLRQLDDNIADIVLYDPPYSVQQAKEVYDNFGKEKLELNVANSKYWTEYKYEVSRIIKPGGIVLCFGWNSNGIGNCNHMVMKEIMIVAHGGIHNDTICTMEIKDKNELF